MSNVYVCVCGGAGGWSLKLRDNGGLNEWNDGGIESGEEEWDGTKWTGRYNPPLSTVAAGPVCQQPGFTAANQPCLELYSRVKSWMWHRWMDMWMEGYG